MHAGKPSLQICTEARWYLNLLECFAYSHCLKVGNIYHQQSSTDDSKDTVQAMEKKMKTVVETQVFLKTLFLKAEVQMSFVEMY